MSSKPIVAGRAVLAVAALIYAASAGAQELGPGETVLDRPRPEVMAQGLRVGDFLIFPAVDLGERYDDNIFRTDEAEEHDFVTVLRPDLAVRSQWSNHALNLDARLESGLHARNRGEDYLDYGFSIDGRIDIRRDSNLFAEAGWKQRHEARGLPDDVAGKEPTEFRVLSARLGGVHGFGRFGLRLEGTARQIDFSDVEAAGGGINNDDRDRLEYEASLRLGYRIVPAFVAFARAAYFVRDYDTARDDNGFERNTRGFEAVLGTELDFGGLAFGEVFVGYRSQDFDDPSFDAVRGLSFGGRVFWNATQLTTVTATAERTLQETTIVGSAGRYDTTFGLELDHELRRDLLLNAAVSGTRQDFRGIDRDDDILHARAGADYLANRYFRLSLDYDLGYRDSDLRGADFLANRVMVTVRLQL